MRLGRAMNFMPLEATDTSQSIVFWAITPCISEITRRFGGIFHLDSQDRNCANKSKPAEADDKLYSLPSASAGVSLIL
jgi:hypothetical protein